MAWDQSRKGGRPHKSAGPRQKLRPNAYARVARSAADNAWLVIAIFAVAAALCAAFAAASLRIDPDQRPRITLDETTARQQAMLDKAFPGVEQTFLARVESSDPETARSQALALASALSAQEGLFLSAFVPGTGSFYRDNAILFEPLADVQAKVEGLILAEPLHYALASAPDMQGFTALVKEIGKAVEQGRSPPGLTALLQAAARAIEGEVRGAPAPVQWVALAGLDSEATAERWYVLATPRPGSERQAAAAARQAAEGMQDVTWLWPRRALASAPSTLRDFVLPAGLSVLVAFALSATILGSVPQALALMLGGAVTLSAAAAAAAATGRPLDAATWSFAMAVLAPALVAGTVLTVAFAEARGRGLQPAQAVMMAAHGQGHLVTAAILLFAAVWLAWLPGRLPSLGQFAMTGLFGCAMAWLVSLTLLPAALTAFAGRSTAAEAPVVAPPSGTAAAHLRNAMDAVAMVVLAAAIFSAAFLPAVRFGERQLPSAPPPQLETPDARGAVHVLAPEDQVGELVARLSAMPEVGAIRTATQFLPPDAAQKTLALQALQSLTPFEPAFRPPVDEAAMAQSLAELSEQLAAIAVGPSTSAALKDAATRLERAVSLLAAPTPPTGERAAALDRALFGGLAQLSGLAARLSALQAPAVSDLDPRLLRRFVSPDGIWRIEVMPQPGLGELSFAAALRRAVPQAAGEPLVSLARNEIIHRATLLALGGALAAMAVLVLLVLRSVRGWVLALAPAGAFITLAAAVTVSLNISLNAAMLAGISASVAVLTASAMRVAGHVSREGGGAFGLSRRAALLPPLVLAGAVAPLTISSRPSVAELGQSLSLLLLVAAVLSLLLVPAMDRWFDALGRGSPSRAPFRD